MKTSLRTIIVIGLTIFTFLPVYSQQLLLSLEEINRQSDMILQVRAESSDSKWVSGPEGKNIITTTRFRVIDCIKGGLSKNQLYTLEMPGGRVGDTTQYVSSSVYFTTGEESILFLQANGTTVTGSTQGKFSVTGETVYIDNQPVSTKIFTETLKASVVSPESLVDFLKTIRSEPLKVWEGAAPVRLKSGNSTTDTYAVTGIKANFVGGVDADGNGFYETYSFSIQINGDADPGPATVYFRWVCNNTGQSWTSSVSSTVTGSAVDYHSYTMNNTHFAGKFTEPTELEFTVEMLDASKTNVLATDSDVTGSVIKVEGPVAAALTITSITPGFQSAGTGSEVTLYGSSFGSTQGTGKVEFFYRDGQPRIQAPVSAWSDTEIVCTVPTTIINNYPASAGSGGVTVTNNAGQMSGEYLYKVSFGYGGTKWATNSVTYRINENLSSITGEGMSVQNAASSWNNSPADFKFVYGGSTTNTALASNGNNDICWGTIATSGVIGQASIWYSGSTIIETDIVFNNSLSWNTSGGVDIESIALHEMGHWLNLRDLYGSSSDGVYDQGKAMYGLYYLGQYRRTPHADDYAGMLWIYGAAESATISGYVKTAAGAAVSSVVMNGFPSNTQTDASGFYSGEVQIGWSGTITPVKAGYTFNLASHTYSNQSASLINQDFTATQVNNIATLSDLKVSGTTVSGFSSTTMAYEVVLPKGTVAVPTVTATTSDANATKVITAATSLPGTTSVVVTAQDGATIKTYTVHFTVTKSSDATLSDLTVSGTTVTGFSKTVLTYSIQLPAGTTAVPPVSASTSDANATRVITQAPALPGTATVVVTAEDGTTRITYTINFTVTLVSSDATLSDLRAGGATVTGFNASTLAYQVELPLGTVSVPAVSATTTHASATAAITPAASLPGTTSVLVTAQDGTSRKTYTIAFSVAKNNDATLSDLGVSGSTVTGFSKSTLTYAVVLPFGTTAVPAVTATTSDANATRVITPATSLPGSTTVVVTAENRTTVQTYTVFFTLQPASTDASLSDLKVNGTSLAGFNPAVTVYSVELPAGTAAVPVVAANTACSFATMAIQNSATLPGTASIQVTAQDGTTRKSYSVNFTLAKNDDASLSDLKVSGTTITGFARTTLVYNIILPFGTTTVPQVSATLNDSRAAQLITAAAALPGTTSILVTAENGVTTQTYTIQFSVESGSSEATLSDLKVDGITVAGFNPTVTVYNVTLPYGTTAVPLVTGNPTSSSATRAITQAAGLPGQAIVVVTAQDGTTKTYTVYLTVARSNDAMLADLRVDGATLAGFARSTFVYSVTLPFGTTAVPAVTATTSHAGALATVSQAPGIPGTAIVHVVAEDGITAVNYTVNFVMSPASADASLASLQVDGQEIQGFNSGTFSYTVVLPYGTTRVPDVQAFTGETHATVVYLRAQSLPGLTTVQVTAQNGSTRNTYSIYFGVAKNSDASLANIHVNGIPIPGFQKTGLTYAITLPANDTIPPSIIAIASDNNAIVEISMPNVFPGTATIRVTAEDRLTIAAYQLFISYGSSGIDDGSQENNLTVYPNPNNGTFTFDYKTVGRNPIRVSIIEVTGRVVFDHLYEGGQPLSEQLQVPDKNHGAYFVRLIDGTSVSYRKIIVE